MLFSGIAQEGDYLAGFSPERYLDDDASTIDPLSYAFGFGRRSVNDRFRCTSDNHNVSQSLSRAASRRELDIYLCHLHFSYIQNFKGA